MSTFSRNERKIGLMATVNDVIRLVTIPSVIIAMGIILFMPRDIDETENLKKVCTNWKADVPVRAIKNGKEVTLSRFTCQSDKGTVYKIEEE